MLLVCLLLSSLFSDTLQQNGFAKGQVSYRCATFCSIGFIQPYVAKNCKTILKTIFSYSHLGVPDTLFKDVIQLLFPAILFDSPPPPRHPAPISPFGFFCVATYLGGHAIKVEATMIVVFFFLLAIREVRCPHQRTDSGVLVWVT